MKRTSNRYKKLTTHEMLLFISYMKVVTIRMKIAPDKKKHFWVGLPLGVVLQFLSFYLLPSQPALSSVVSFVVLAAICYGFELFSLFTGKGHYDNIDAVAG